jgi:hypothetical protein
MQAPPQNQYRPRRLTAWGVAALAAALFTPVPAIADMARDPVPAAVTPAIQDPATQEFVAAPAAYVRPVVGPANSATPALAQSLISTGMIGIGLAMGGLAIITHRRRQW